MILICIDPGETIGYAELLYTDDEAAIIVDAREISTPKGKLTSITAGWELLHLLDTFWDHARDDEVIIVMEDWEWRRTAHSVDARPACGIIALVQYKAEEMGIPVVMQRPFVRLSVNDAMLRRGNYWSVGGAGHKREATRHGLRFLINQLHRPTMELLMAKTENSDGV